MNWFIDPIKNHYVDFNGRATRQQYGMYTLGYIIAYIVVVTVARLINLDLLAMLFSLALLLPSLAISVRRIHDLGQSGWWALLFLIPLINLVLWLVLLIHKGQPADNQYGPVVGAVPQPAQAQAVPKAPDSGDGMPDQQS